MKMKCESSLRILIGNIFYGTSNRLGLLCADAKEIKVYKRFNLCFMGASFIQRAGAGVPCKEPDYCFLCSPK